MQPDDVEAALAVRFSTIENAVTLAELRDENGVTPGIMREALRTASRGWVCEEAGTIVGFAIGHGPSGEVKVVAVTPGHEGRGIGKTVLGHVRDWLFAQGHARIWLCANPDPGIRASGFYRRLGWRRTGERRGADEILVLDAATQVGIHPDPRATARRINPNAG